MQVVELLYGDRSHSELLRRGLPVLEVLLNCGRLSQAHLHCLWRALTLVRHVATGVDYSVLEETLLSIAKFLPDALLQFMWRLIIAAHPSDAAAASAATQSSASSTLSFSSIASTQESRVVSALSACVGLRFDPKSRDQRRLVLAFKFASSALEVEHRTIKDENKRSWCAVHLELQHVGAATAPAHHLYYTTLQFFF